MNSSLKTVIEIDPSTAIHFSLSKRLFNIDLDITGGGMVNYNMLKNKQMMLSGVYDISEGSAQLKLTGWPNKSFRIAESGFIRWDGVVDDPELSFSAINRVTSSYVNPVDGKSREVDFDVILQLSNKLSDLDVGFTVQTKDQYIMSILKYHESGRTYAPGHFDPSV